MRWPGQINVTSGKVQMRIDMFGDGEKWTIDVNENEPGTSTTVQELMEGLIISIKLQWESEG